MFMNNNREKMLDCFYPIFQNDGSHSKRILDSPVSFWFRDQSILLSEKNGEKH